jgi:hypothetical protein
MGAITWRYPLIRSLEYNGTQYKGDEIVEAARICIGVDFPQSGLRRPRPADSTIFPTCS